MTARTPPVATDWLRPFGQTDITVSAVCAGGAQLGGMPELFGYDVTETAAIDLVRLVLDSPLRFLDTANGYGAGRSEERIGQAIVQHGGLPDDFVISTKVDALDGDYSGARVRDSVRESKQRLGHIGVAGGDTREIGRYVDLGVFEALLVHNRWTLVDRSGGPLFDQAAEAGMAILNAAIYGGGLLTRSGGNGNYAYRPARPAVQEAAEAMSQVCQWWGTDLATAALLFSLRDPRITSTVTGFTKPSTMTRTLEALDTAMPEPFWDELEALVPASEHWLDNKSPIVW